MGSLRNPAAFNNVIGFRPSFGRVPAGPAEKLYLAESVHGGADGPQRARRGDAAFGDGWAG